MESDPSFGESVSLICMKATAYFAHCKKKYCGKKACKEIFMVDSVKMYNLARQ